MPSIGAVGSTIAASSMPSVPDIAATWRSLAILPRPTIARRMAVTATCPEVEETVTAMLFAPSQHKWTETLRDLDQTCAYRRVQWLQRQPDGFVPDDTALLHQRLAGD